MESLEVEIPAEILVSPVSDKLRVVLIGTAAASIGYAFYLLWQENKELRFRASVAEESAQHMRERIEEVVNTPDVKRNPVDETQDGTETV